MPESTTQLGPSLFHALQQSGDNTRTERLELIETHISWVILCSNFAWKIKKPVKFAFADFSTLKLRKHFCEEEIRLNGRLAPQLYLAVVPITGSIESPEIDGAGPVIDHAVQMKRFPDESLLSRVAERNELTRNQIDDLADQVARFHQHVAVTAPDSTYGSSEKIWKAASENFQYLKQHLSDPEQLKLLEQVEQAATTAWDSFKLDAEVRKNAGFVRECHGDMHLGNMVLLDGRVTVFDGIDFNPDFRWIDVMQEAAFVVMDLQRRNHSAEAWEFLNRYCEVTGDYSGLKVLAFYVSYLAMVRAKVTVIQLEQHVSENPRLPLDEQTASKPKSLRESENRVVSLMKFALKSFTPQRPKLFITHGFSGSGKSTISRELIGLLGAIRIRSDVERKRIQNESRLPDEMYSARAREAVYDRLAEISEQIVQSGQSVIVDATFLQANQRTLFQEVADRTGTTFVVLDLQVPVEELKQRLRMRNREKSNISDADIGVLEQQLQQHDPLTELERQSTLPIDATLAPTDAAAKLMAALKLRE